MNRTLSVALFGLVVAVQLNHTHSLIVLLCTLACWTCYMWTLDAFAWWRGRFVRPLLVFAAIGLAFGNLPAQAQHYPVSPYVFNRYYHQYSIPPATYYHPSSYEYQHFNRQRPVIKPQPKRPIVIKVPTQTWDGRKKVIPILLR